MALLYKNAKKEVDQEFNELTKAGWKPVANPDGKTYHWENAKGEIRRGAGEPTQGISADAGFLKRNFKREARQDRLMSEKVTAMLPLQGEKKAEEPGTKPNEPAKPSTTTPSGYRDLLGEGMAAWKSKQSTKAPVKEVVGGLDRNPFIARPPVKDNIPTWMPPDKSNGVVPITTPGQPTSIVEDLIPEYDEKNTTDPFVYIDQEKWQAMRGPVGRFWSNMYNGTSSLEIETEQKGKGPTAMDVANTIPRTREIAGRKQVLIQNPHFDVPKQRIDRQIAGALQTFLTPAGVGSLPGAQVAAGSSMRAGAMAQKAAKASTAAQKATETAVTSKTKLASWKAGLAQKVAKYTAKDAQGQMKRARAWDRLASSQKLIPKSTATTKTVKQVVDVVEETPKAIKPQPKALGPRNIPTGKVVSPSTGTPMQMGPGGVYELPGTPIRQALPPWNREILPKGPAELPGAPIRRALPMWNRGPIPSGGKAKLKPRSTTKGKGK
jgi:hypothetical protein